MADEKIVSSVYFRGNKIGGADLTVTDTSIKPTYNISYWRGGVSVANAQDLLPNKNMNIQFNQTPVRADVPKLYYDFTGTDAARFLITGDAHSAGPTSNTITLNSSGVGTILIFVNFYPNTTELNATLNVYNDAAKTSLVASIPIKQKAVTGAFVKLRAGRSAGLAVDLTPMGIYNNDELLIEYTDDRIKAGDITGRLPLTLKINNTDVPKATYTSSSASWIVGAWTPEVSVISPSAGASVKIPRQRHPSVRGNVTGQVLIGSIQASNQITDEMYGYLVGENIQVNTTGSYVLLKSPLPAGVSNVNAFERSSAYGFWDDGPHWPIGTDTAPTAPDYPEPRYYMPFISIANFNKPSNGQMSLQSYSGESKRAGGGNGTVFVEKSQGRLTYLSWCKEALDTAAKRKQFGKYQQTVRMRYKYQNVNGQIGLYYLRGDLALPDPNDYTSAFRSLTLDVVNNPIATAQYGALTTLTHDQLCCFAFGTADASLTKTYFHFSPIVALLRDYGWVSAFAVNYTAMPSVPPADPSNPNDLTYQVDVLFLRPNRYNELNQFDANTPYPRIVNAQQLKGYEAYKFTTKYGNYWNFYLESGGAIDLMNGRYVAMVCIQNDSANGFEFWTNQSVNIVSRTSNRITFRAGIDTTAPSLSVAIIDMGP